MVSVAAAGKIAWVVGLLVWYAIRHSFARRAKRARVSTRIRSLSERIGLAAGALGIAIIPGIYVATGFPRRTEYPPRAWAVILGAAFYGGALWLFWRSHKDLGRNWSVTLELREEHRVVANGVYAAIRHPMYASFWLMAVGQALLLPNWFAGPAALAGIAVLFFLRVGEEERMMLQAFGEEYRAYMQRTKRIIPRVY
ncbi:MAG TPA: protein-S-isoprenylcysteine O-methyltransferase [Xanthobacteraceae bacterium]|nr:protein-S-isoprenylcysteine O-methyltransferase [Xanthobacteraceae bacterium]